MALRYHLTFIDEGPVLKNDKRSRSCPATERQSSKYQDWQCHMQVPCLEKVVSALMRMMLQLYPMPKLDPQAETLPRILIYKHIYIHIYNQGPQVRSWLILRNESPFSVPHDGLNTNAPRVTAGPKPELQKLNRLHGKRCSNRKEK